MADISADRDALKSETIVAIPSRAHLFTPERRPQGGRTVGTRNRITERVLKAMEDVMLASDPAVHLTRLRDSDDPSDRRTFWAIVMKMLPTKIEGHVGVTLEALVAQSRQPSVIDAEPVGPDSPDPE